MPIAIVPPWALARSPSSRSPTRRLVAGLEHFARDLAAGRERRARQRQAAAAARVLELELALDVGHHDEAAFRLGDVERRVDHERQHLIEHAARSQRAQAVEDRPPSAPGRSRRSTTGAQHRRGVLVGQEHHFDVVAVSQPDGVAVHQRALGDLLAVHEGAVTRGPIAQQVTARVVAHDLGVLARDVGADELEIGGRAASDDEREPAHRYQPLSLCVGEAESGFCHAGLARLGLEHADLNQQPGEVVDPGAR